MCSYDGRDRGGGEQKGEQREREKARDEDDVEITKSHEIEMRQGLGCSWAEQHMCFESSYAFRSCNAI